MSRQRWEETLWAAQRPLGVHCGVASHAEFRSQRTCIILCKVKDSPRQLRSHSFLWSVGVMSNNEDAMDVDQGSGAPSSEKDAGNPVEVLCCFPFPCNMQETRANLSARFLAAREAVTVDRFDTKSWDVLASYLCIFASSRCSHFAGHAF